MGERRSVVVQDYPPSPSTVRVSPFQLSEDEDDELPDLLPRDINREQVPCLVLVYTFPVVPSVSSRSRDLWVGTGELGQVLDLVVV